MVSILDAVFYLLVFLSVYIQIFFLITFLENRKRISVEKMSFPLGSFRSVTIIVPCWNEERTVFRTVRSLLDLCYPKDKLWIFLIDDGSTDGTLSLIRKFAKYPNVRIFHQENKGKYTALNLGLAHTKTSFVGCLDADSVAHPKSLFRIMRYFERDPTLMAVVPSVVASTGGNPIQGAQRAEYHLGVFTKKMLGFMDAIHVTPGPLTIFRKRVFDELGPYRHGHSTEDMEIAYRMQKNGYRITHCHDAYVYTNIPSTIGKLYRQRLRWIYGFINNTIDYRDTLFRKKYGNFALFTLPVGLVAIFGVSYLFGRVVYNLGDFLYTKIVQAKATGWYFAADTYEFDLFFFNPRFSFFLLFIIYSLVVFWILFGRKMSEGRWVVSLDLLYFLIVFRVLAPLWIIQAMWRTVLRRRPAWR